MQNILSIPDTVLESLGRPDDVIQDQDSVCLPREVTDANDVDTNEEVQKHVVEDTAFDIGDAAYMLDDDKIEVIKAMHDDKSSEEDEEPPPSPEQQHVLAVDASPPRPTAVPQSLLSPPVSVPPKQRTKSKRVSTKSS